MDYIVISKSSKELATTVKKQIGFQSQYKSSSRTK